MNIYIILETITISKYFDIKILITKYSIINCDRTKRYFFFITSENQRQIVTVILKRYK